MAGMNSQRLLTLLNRELQEYRASLLFTPAVIAGLSTVLMLVSLLIAGRFGAIGGDILDALLEAEMTGQPVITINIDDEEVHVVEHTTGHMETLQLPEPPAPPEPVKPAEPPMPPAVVEDVPGDESEWNFAREWRFEPKANDNDVEWETEEVGSLNPVLNVMHGFMLLVLIIVTVSYLLGCMYNDRKDRSILFWKSLPVSEWEEVGVRLGVALLVAPAVYISFSLILQMVFVLLAMVTAWQLDKDPFEVILGNIKFGDLLVQQVLGWLLTALWVAPVYAYLMLASAWAKRAPLLVAIVPVFALSLAEGLLIGTNFVRSAVINHVPHYIGGDSVVGFYFHSGFWANINYLSLFLGLVFAAAAVVGSVYLRRYRFEI